MIAYRHHIKFVPELERARNGEASLASVITIEQSSSYHIYESFSFEVTFSNNQGRDLTLYSDREIVRRRKGQLWAFEVSDVVTFFWHSGTPKLAYLAHKKFTSDLLRYWCLHIVLPIFFTIEETYDFLHAGAVEVAGRPVLFVAESFGGKSTMTDFFMKQGHRMISDDKVATYEKDGVFYAVPSHPHHRPYRKMEELGERVENFSVESKPIHAIYDLERAAADVPVKISALHGTSKFVALRYASEINFFFQKKLRFESLMEMAKVHRVFRVTVPWDMERLDEVYRAVIAHNQSLGSDRRP